MADDPKSSPAVKAYELEKARQREQEDKGDLVKVGPPKSHTGEGAANSVRSWIKENPLTAVALTATIGWILGATR